MTKRIFHLALFIVVLLAVSCKKDVPVDQMTLINNTRDLKVSDGFSWSTSRAVNAEIRVALPSASGMLSTIEIYKDDPSTGGQPLVTGSAGYGFPFSTSLLIPAYVTGLWINAFHPDGTSQTDYLPVTGNQLDHTFALQDKMTALKNNASGPDCNTGCDQTISGSGSVTVKNGQTYCVTGTFTGTINFEHWNGGGTLRVCGTATPQNVNNMGNNCNIVVADGGTFTIGNLTMDGTASVTAWNTASVTISTLNMNQTTTRLINYSGNFKINNTFSPNGKVDNYGTLIIAGTYNGNSSAGYLNNSGTMTISGSLNMNHPLTNSGTITISESLNLNTAHAFQNSCKIVVQQSANLNNGTLTMNAGFLKVNNSFVINSPGLLVLQNQSMINAINVTLNNNISGTGSKSTIRSSGTARINSSKTVSGAIEWADNDGVLANGNTGLFINGATFVTFANATNYIPVTPCNSEGFGVPPIIDNDGDGVPDNDDDYPTDPSRAYDNYYPSPTSWASMAFEDLWPSYGDFDMNDLVVNVRFNRVTNAQNNVVELNTTYKALAVGGSFKNGLAYQLDNVDIGSIQTVTGTVTGAGSYLTFDVKGLESGTTKPVVVVWDNTDRVIHRAGGSFFNTENNGFTGTSDTVKITVHFATPQSPAAVGLPPYNHFIMQNQVRGHEIHLPGNIPTSKADVSLFGTSNDDTNPAAGKYYKSDSNLPWAIFIAEEFNYPVERADIATAHLKFASWAQSSGAQYPDWYMNKPGYRNPANIYGN